MLYMTYDDPQNALRRLAFFIVTIYAPMWFAFRRQPLATDAPRHVFQTMKLLLALPIFERGFHWGNPEILQVAMLADSKRETRIQAIDRILTSGHSPIPSTSSAGSRKQARKGLKSTICTYKLFTPNYEAKRWEDMTKWESAPVYEPPLT
jgi:hypothetical protein